MKKEQKVNAQQRKHVFPYKNVCLSKRFEIRHLIVSPSVIGYCGFLDCAWAVGGDWSFGAGQFARLGTSSQPKHLTNTGTLPEENRTASEQHFLDAQGEVR
jgi:hypothetical protein